MKGIRTHKQAIQQIADETGLTVHEVAKICDMAFSARGVQDKMKYPNVIMLPKIGTLKPLKMGIQRIKDAVIKIKRIKDAEKQTRKYHRDKLKALPEQETDYYKEYFFDKDYLEELIQSNFTYHYHTWTMQPHQHQPASDQ